MELTKSAKKSLAILYKEYCQRIKSGVRKSDARRIHAGEYPAELLDDLKELREAGAIKVDMGGKYRLGKQSCHLHGKSSRRYNKELAFIRRSIYTLISRGGTSRNRCIRSALRG